MKLEEKIVNEIIAISHKHDNIKRVVLFGSRARGDNSLKSDIDLAIYCDTSIVEFIEDIEMKTSTLLEFDFSDMKDIHNEAFVEQVEIKKCPRGNFPWGTFYIKFRFRNCTFIFISYIIKRK